MTIPDNVYFDTEFTGLVKDTDLLSLGMVHVTYDAEYPYKKVRSLYIEFNDYDPQKLNGWVINNVMKNLLSSIDFKSNGIRYVLNQDAQAEPGINGSHWYSTVDSKREAALLIEAWLSDLKEVQLVSDVCSYDFVLFQDIFGGAFSTPSKIVPYCRDINQEIVRHGLAVDYRQAFDLNREELYQKLFDKNEEFDINVHVPEYIKDRKHNALWDAFVIAGIDQNLD